MKHLFIIIASTLLAACLTVGCKPSESAYKAAYESALAKRNAAEASDTVGGGVQGTVYNRYRELQSVQLVPLGNDTLPVVTEFVGYTKDGGATRENTGRYNVVVARFKQVFNARQMRERLMANGYPDAMILHTREPLYYVVTASCSTAQSALEELKRVEADKQLVLRAPLPFVLQPAHLKR